MVNVRIVLSALWLATMLVFLLGDVIRIFAGDFTAGELAGKPATPAMWLLVAVIMLTPIVMIVLSLVLPYPAARWVSMVAAIVWILFNLAGLPYKGAYDNSSQSRSPGSRCWTWFRRTWRRSTTCGPGHRTSLGRSETTRRRRSRSKADLDDLPDGFSRADEVVYLAHARGMLLGYAEVLRGFAHPGQWMIGIVLVDEKARGAGVGRAIVEAVVADARSAGTDSLAAGVITSRVRSLSFWHREGFSFERLRRPITVCGEPAEVVRLEHRL